MNSRDLRDLILRRDDFLFDLDGTLVDSSPSHERAFVRALEVHRPDLLSRFEYEACKGQASEAVFGGLGIEPGSERLLLMAAKQENYRRELTGGRVGLIAGALELVAGLAALGKRVFLVTGGSMDSTVALLARTGLGAYVSGLVTGGDVSCSKPAPDPFLVCLSRFGLARGRCVVVEDSSNGVESARAAGLVVVAVNNPKLAALPEYVGPLMNMCEALRDLRTCYG